MNSDFRVLLVTDNELFGSTVSCIVQDLGLILFLCDGLDGLFRALTMGPLPDAVILDQNLPAPQWETMRRRLSERASWRQLPFLVIGDKPREGYLTLVGRAGLVDFLAQPFHPRKILRWMLRNRKLFGGKPVPDGTGTIWRRKAGEDKQELGILLLDDDPLALTFPTCALISFSSSSGLGRAFFSSSRVS